MARIVEIQVIVQDAFGGRSAPASAQLGINEPPVIQQVLVSPAVVAPGGQAIITILATDPEGDGLVYEVSASEGTIAQGSAPNEFIFTAPF